MLPVRSEQRSALLRRKSLVLLPEASRLHLRPALPFDAHLRWRRQPADGGGSGRGSERTMCEQAEGWEEREERSPRTVPSPPRDTTECRWGPVGNNSSGRTACHLRYCYCESWECEWGRHFSFSFFPSVPIIRLSAKRLNRKKRGREKNNNLGICFSVLLIRSKSAFTVPTVCFELLL